MRERIKSTVASAFARVTARVLGERQVEQRLWQAVNAPRRFDRLAGNIEAELVRRATWQTAEYVEQRMSVVPGFDWRFDLMQHALSRAGHDGMYLEFGVEDGESINFIADHVRATVHGFDSFRGLPESWNDRNDKGAMNMDGRPPAVRSNVELHTGWFDQQLPGFVARHAEPAAFIHVDCDLYSSTRCVFQNLAERVRQGTVILFDEYFNYPGWKNHEFKAFQEFVSEHNVRYDYLGYVRTGYSVAVVIQ
jgi:hypothetical protein